MTSVFIIGGKADRERWEPAISTSNAKGLRTQYHEIGDGSAPCIEFAGSSDAGTARYLLIDARSDVSTGTLQDWAVSAETADEETIFYAPVILPSHTVEYPEGGVEKIVQSLQTDDEWPTLVIAATKN